jgi:hypothetical protein
LPVQHGGDPGGQVEGVRDSGVVMSCPAAGLWM